MNYVHLHVHSEFSLLQSAAKIKDLVREAVTLNFSSIAITDVDAMHGIIPFYKECLEQGIKPIIGVELAVARSVLSEREHAPYRLLFLAKNNQGYRDLLTLTSRAQTKEKALNPYITFQEMMTHLSDVFVISPFEQGEIQQLVETGSSNEANELLKQLQSFAGKENVYIEIQNHWRKKERERLLALRTWLNDKQFPVVASNHVHFIHKNQVDAHRVLQAIRAGERLSSMSDEVTCEEYSLKSEEEMREVFPSWIEALEESGRIAEKCHVEIDLGKPVLPHFPVPKESSSHQYLKDICERGLYERYSSPSDEVRNRLDFELKVISDMNYEDYFLIVADFMKYAHEQKILTGPGRGSAAGSLVAYVLKITNVDPIKYGLLFERFLNPERVSMPDIDIDFSDQQRDEVIQYVARKYGKNHVAQIVTFGTLAAKAALRDSGKALSVEATKIDRVAKLIPSRPNIRLRDAVKENTTLKEMIANDEELIEWFRIAENIEGLPRHTSIHAAGVVISKEPLTEVVPLQMGNDGLYLTQFPMGDLENIGLLKMDFLGLRNLSFIDRVLRLILKNRGEAVSINNLPPYDEKTFRMLGEGDTSGIFQLESSGMKSVLRRLKPTHFEDIVAVNALYRPGPMDNIPAYIARKHGEKPVSYPHPDLEKILKPTYGVMIYQEQIMQVASKMAGFSLGEADVLRRAVGKKKREVLEETRAQFVEGAKRKGYSFSESEIVYDLIVQFADYGFNRSHAVAYSMISYQLAYLKANFPLEFLSGLMDMSIHHQDKLSEYISEAKRKGIDVDGPSILHSEALFTVKDHTIWIGLASLKNIGFQAVDIITEERKKAPFASLFDLCARIPTKFLPRRALEALTFTGALDDFKVDRAVLLASIDDAMDFGAKEREKAERGQAPLFFEEEHEPRYTDVAPLSDQDRLRYEKEVLGFYASGHPIEQEREMLDSYGRSMIAEINEEAEERKMVRIAGLVEESRVIQTKKKEQMAFLRMSDDTGEVEVTIFPKPFQKFQTKIQKDELLFVEGRLQEHKGANKILLDKCITVEELKRKQQERNQPVLYLYITNLHERDGTLDKLKRYLQDTPGEVAVVLKYESNKKAIRLSEMWNVASNDSFILKIKGLLGNKNVFLKKPRV
ncbi:DNA polymerase III subunit alpha [Salipaludibacillus keqinensis]|uniref:DNA polymerase III subunit alpha n=1 Tax=Salipaludibacillus keqinensis TaxID=2045207 RepID=A0A323TM73_9BACI|nr:DNA polymerase III subunit alpha [Salipaludibacillus keqinensis]PYZ93743.1 DNA polymerase III subunit alpha [Salipaludibacillus keqinensis]